MGWFSRVNPFKSKKVVYVASNVVPMYEDDTAKYVPSTALHGILRGEQNFGKYFNDCLITSPGMRLRQFCSWGKQSGYTDAIGLMTSSYYPGITVDRTSLYNLLISLNPLLTTQTLEVLDGYVEFFKEKDLADFWIWNYYPAYRTQEYDLDYDYVVIGTHTERRSETYHEEGGEGGGGTYTTWYEVTVNDYRADTKITFNDGKVVTINASNYDKHARYLTITYLINDWNDKHTEVTKTTYYRIYYKYGSGKSYFDNYFSAEKVQELTYVPVIPLMQNQKWYSSSYEPNIYNWAVKAYKKITNSTYKNKFDKLIDSLKENDSIDDVNFVYILYGASLNTQYQDARKYIFTFFYNLYINKTLSTSNSYYNINSSDSVYVKSNYGIANYNTRIEYTISDYSIKNGKADNDAIAGEYYFSRYADTYIIDYYQSEAVKYPVYQTDYYVYMRHQISENKYEQLTFTKLKYINTIYAGKSVSYDGYEELGKDDSCSGFIIPLQRNTLQETALIATSDLANHSSFLVFNSYIIQKIRWYQRGLFKIAFIIIMIVIIVIATIFTAGAATAPTTGILASVLMAMGFVGSTLLYAIAYAVAQMLICMIISAIIMAVSKKLIGGVWSTIVGLVASMIACYGAISYLGPVTSATTAAGSAVGSVGMSGGGAIAGSTVSSATAGSAIGTATGGATTALQTSFFGELFKPGTMFMLTNSGLSVYNAYAAETVSYYNTQINNLLTQTNEILKDIQNKYKSNFSNYLDTSLVLDSVLYPDTYIPESATAFLTRTLMTTEIITLSYESIGQFAIMTLDLPLPLTS